MPYFYPVVQVKEKIITKPFPRQMKQTETLSLRPSILCVIWQKWQCFSILPFFFLTLCFSNFKVFLQVKKLHVFYPVFHPVCCSGFPWLRYVWLPWGRRSQRWHWLPLRRWLQLRAESGVRAMCTPESNARTQKCFVCNIREV